MSSKMETATSFKLYYSARYSIYEVRFGRLFLAQIAPCLQNKKRALHANLSSNLDKLTGPWHFQMPVLIVEKQRKIIYKILMLLLQSNFRA